MQLAARLIVIPLIFVLSSCGTLFTGSTDLITVNSEPSGAKVMIDGMYMGVTPVSASLKRDKDHHIIIKKDGYQDASAVISRSFNGVSLLNLISPLCWIVDIVTGGMWKFERNAIGVELEPLNKETSYVPTISPGEGMKITTTKSGKTAVYLE